MKIIFVKLCVIIGTLSSCAVLHHVQVGSIDNTQAPEEIVTPFDIKVSETGVNTDEAGSLSNQNEIATAIALFQMGDRTGNPVYNEKYAEGIIHSILEKCPSGKITNLMSIREARKYPVISGEIVKITGVCKTSKTKGI